MKKLLGILIGLGLFSLASFALAAWSLPPQIFKGDLIVATSTTQSVRLATGTLGTVLMMFNGVPTWRATSTLGISGGSGITSLNGLTGSTQTFSTNTTATGLNLNITSGSNNHDWALSLQSGYNIPLTASTTQWANLQNNVLSRLAISTGTSGTIFNISTTTNSLTINLPIASAINTGQLSAANWATFNNKVGTSTALTTNAIPIVTTGSTLGNSSLSQVAGTTLINGSTAIIDGGGNWLSNVIQTSGSNIILQTPTSTTVVGNFIQAGGVTRFSTSTNITGLQFVCGLGLFYIDSTSTQTTNIKFPDRDQMAAGAATGCGGGALTIWASQFGQSIQYNASTSSPISLSASGTGETLLFAPGSGPISYPGQAVFSVGGFAASTTISGANTNGMIFNAHIANFQARPTQPTIQGQFLTASSTPTGGNVEWNVTNFVSTASVTINTSTPGQISFTSVGGSGSGSSTWTQYNGGQYNGLTAASSTESVTIGTTTPQTTSQLFLQGNGTKAMLTIASSSGGTVLRVLESLALANGTVLLGPSVSNTVSVNLTVAASSTRPTYAFNGNFDTGMYATSTQFLGFSTAGVGRMVINPTGVVGIGTLVPTTTQGAILQVNDAGSNFARIVLTASTTNQVVGFLDARGDAVSTAAIQFGSKSAHPLLFFTSDSSRLGVYPTGGMGFGSTYSFATDPGVNNAVFQGRVGIGTSTPGAMTDIQGTGGLMPFRVTSSTGTSLFEVEQSGNVGIGTSTAQNTLTVIGSISSSALTSGNCVQAGAGGVLTTVGAACGSGGSGVTTWLVGNGTLYNSTSTDNIGIGTSTPQGKLTVQGSAGSTRSLLSLASSTGGSALEVYTSRLSQINVGTGTTSPSNIAELYIKGFAASGTFPTLVVASSTGTRFLTVEANGSTTLASLGTGCVSVISGTLNTTSCGGTASGTTGSIQYSDGSGGFNASGMFNWSQSEGKLRVGTTTASSYFFNFQIPIVDTIATLRIASRTNQPLFVIGSPGAAAFGTTTENSSLTLQATAGTIPIFTIASSTGTLLRVITAHGHTIVNQATAPGLSAGAGAGFAGVATDGSGIIRVGTAAVTTVTLTFTVPYSNVPRCNADISGTLGIGVSSTPTTLVISSSIAMDNAFINYDCEGLGGTQ